MPPSLPLTLLAVLAGAASTAQTLVSTEPQPRTALLEKYTAINCGNCPAAATVSNTLQGTYADDLVIMNIHGGGLANPANGQLDFRTPDGAALWSQFGVSFQPQGSVGRGLLQTSGFWNTSIQSVLAQTSHVNIGAASVHDAGLGQLTVTVELYYTAEAPAFEERIHVALTEDHITGYQQDYVNGAQPNYDHRHVFRDLLTPLNGDPVFTTAERDFVQRNYTAAIPAAWEVSNLQVVAFVSTAGGLVWQVRSVAANGAGTVGVDGDARYAGVGAAFPVPAQEVVTIPFTAEAHGMLQLHDAQGRLVKEVFVADGTAHVRLPVNELAPGVYTYGFATGSARRLVVE